MNVSAGLLTMLIAAATAGADGGVMPAHSLKTRAVEPTAKLGDVFTVEVMITHDSGQRYELVAPTETGAFDFVTSERSRRDGDGSSTTTFLAKFQGFELGHHTTPQLVFEVTEASGTAQITAPGVDVEIVATLPPDAESKGENLYDIRPPMEIPVRTWRLLYALLAVLGIGALAWAIRKYVKRPKAAVIEPEKPRIPLHVRTLEALDSLAKENLPGQARVKEFYFRLSDIMRGYLGERYAFDARESTTPELLDALRSRSTPGLPFKELSDFAHESDFVRYAKAEVAADNCKTALELAYRIVHGTTVAPQALPPDVSHQNHAAS